ncbi:MAG: CoA-binding protein [candidate division WOR-3 bacterium]|nr:CoA-binding protein [candidate division WOR-3 bacterium]MCX7947670.1 CoA-binding protein [candidate division WOR-3 bacterium]MDW8150547.1 CoA-binding protein [candidate division WOR-3 bacterium]
MILENKEKLLSYLKNAKKIAVIGIKDSLNEPAGKIPRYLLSNGYEVIPINPKLEVWLGRKVYKKVDEIEEEVDIVNIFRRSEYILEHAREILNMKHKPKLVWLQEGIVNEDAAKILSDNGIDVVMDTCIYKIHSYFKSRGEL